MLPFYRAWIDDRDIEEVVDTLRSGWLTMGPKTLQFEEKFARYVGARNAIAVNSCTAGLHLALDAIGLKPGDEVITSVYTFTSTAAVMLHLGARPVLVDVVPGALQMDPALVERAITPRTRAIVPVHMAGAPCEMDALLELASRHGLKIVEDAAHALPTRYKGHLVGSIGDLTVFSFYAVKNLTTGEGGMVTTDSDQYANLLRTRRLHGITPRRLEAVLGGGLLVLRGRVPRLQVQHDGPQRGAGAPAAPEAATCSTPCGRTTRTSTTSACPICPS